MSRPDPLVSAGSVRFLHAVAEDDRVTPDATAPLVPWWSFTKPVIATAALVLVAGGRLALDQNLPDRRYTLRQLLQHRAGIPDYGGLAAYRNAVAGGEKPWSAAELMSRIEADRPKSPPGMGWTYSNVGYLMIRQLIEDAADEDLDLALVRLVLRPLGISGVHLAQKPADLAKTAWGNAAGYDPGWVYHGLLIGAAPAAALLLHRIMTGALLPPDLLNAMRARHALGNPPPGRPWRTAGYGLGLMMDGESPAGPALGHSGLGPGSAAAVYHFPALRPARTVAVFAPIDNEGPVETQALALAAS